MPGVDRRHHQHLARFRHASAQAAAVRQLRAGKSYFLRQAALGGHAEHTRLAVGKKHGAARIDLQPWQLKDVVEGAPEEFRQRDRFERLLENLAEHILGAELARHMFVRQAAEHVLVHELLLMLPDGGAHGGEVRHQGAQLVATHLRQRRLVVAPRQAAAGGG